MREIKFRAWTGSKFEYDITTGKFGTFFVNKGIKGDGLHELDSATLTPFNTKLPDDTPVMQFTGLHDKNGKEIWEGDIYEYQHVLGKEYWNVDKVEWQENMAGWGIDKRDSKLSVVIGNIYETPELLA